MEGLQAAEQNSFDGLPTDTKLYVFHHFGGSQMQQLAAVSLNKAGWRFNTKYQKWTKSEQGKVIWYDEKSGKLLEGEGGVGVGVWDWC